MEEKPSNDVVIVINNGDGTVKTVSDLQYPIDNINIQNVIQGADYRVSTLNKLPDYYFREAWTDDNDTDTVDIDIERAKDIHMNKIKKVRDRLLKELDIETLKGRDVQDEKQVLRDLPQTVDLSTVQTPEDLKAIIPAQVRDVWND